MPSRNQFDRLWMDIAFRVAALSKDPMTKVGAVIVRGDRELSVGYNGMPAGVPEEAWMWERPMKYDIVKHAEENAVANAPFDTKGCSIYVTHQPCPRCFGLIINAGILRVVYCHRYEAMTDNQRRAWDHLAGSFPGSVVELAAP